MFFSPLRSAVWQHGKKKGFVTRCVVSNLGLKEKSNFILQLEKNYNIYFIKFLISEKSYLQYRFIENFKS